MIDDQTPETLMTEDDLLAYGERLKRHQALAADRAIAEMLKLVRSNGEEGYADIVAQAADDADGSGEFRMQLMHELTLRGIDT